LFVIEAGLNICHQKKTELKSAQGEGSYECFYILYQKIPARRLLYERALMG
jgi:hypothetical protein